MSIPTPVFGLLIEYFETGTEGVVWALQQDGTAGYEGLIILEPGDQVDIFNHNGQKVYGGIIVPDYSIGARQRPGSTISQPVALGRWAHWIQSGFEPDVWAEYFCSGRFRGAIYKRA
ncbi:hypothetical protein [Gilvimarinus xylanilyticus]|uniref:Uncharacterized protein n=1 Tax=Gilvimarinus xylanilyticus TaxID=2944139 RepID=A0A9X2KU81_9GAMM|nr:hypothetical protein [Gilvimarinus xylanilyticus]MCP8900059.1 hypothetical protein [Gilvimarinus xylanilyticus]